MKAFRLITIAAALVAVSGTAYAGSYTPATVAPYYPAPAAPAGHDWTGMYGDAYVGHWFSGGIPGNFVGANLGYNMSNGSIVYGGEVGAYFDPSSGASDVSVSAPVGAALSPDLLGFGRIGVEQDFAPSSTNYLLGLGGQYALRNNMYLRGEYVYESPLGGGASATSLRLGAGWEF